MKEKNIGALWSKTTKTGKNYMSGHIEINGTIINIVIFGNSYKEKNKQPDWLIYKSIKNQSVPQDNNHSQGDADNNNYDDIPF